MLAVLAEKGRLDLSMEVLVLDPQFRELFTDVERAAARGRLEHGRALSDVAARTAPR